MGGHGRTVDVRPRTGPVAQRRGRTGGGARSAAVKPWLGGERRRERGGAVVEDRLRRGCEVRCAGSSRRGSTSGRSGSRRTRCAGRGGVLGPHAQLARRGGDERVAERDRLVGGQPQRRLGAAGAADGMGGGPGGAGGARLQDGEGLGVAGPAGDGLGPVDLSCVALGERLGRAGVVADGDEDVCVLGRLGEGVEPLQDGAASSPPAAAGRAGAGRGRRRARSPRPRRRRRRRGASRVARRPAPQAGCELGDAEAVAFGISPRGR